MCGIPSKAHYRPNKPASPTWREGEGRAPVATVAVAALGVVGRLLTGGSCLKLGQPPPSSAIPSAHHWLAEGGAEVDLMRLAGWRSRAMGGPLQRPRRRRPRPRGAPSAVAR
jgi:hypothetical protein